MHNLSSAALSIAAILCVITAFIHSVLGERRLIQPILASGIPAMETSLGRNVTRFAWHWTSVLWACVAATLWLAAIGEVRSPLLILVIGGAHVIAGVGDAVLTKGRHVGWPFITLIGALVLYSYFTSYT